MQTNFFFEGDQSKAICGDCKALRSTTFRYRDVPFSDGTGTVKHILAGVCNECDSVVSIPAQSTPAISKARNKVLEAVEAVLPAPYLDILDLACFKIDPESSTDLRKGLLMFYVHQFAEGSFDFKRLKRSSKTLASRPGMESKTRRRLSMKTTHRLAMAFESITERSSMNKTEMIKAIIGTIQEDIVDDGLPELIQNFKEYAIFASA